MERFRREIEEINSSENARARLQAQHELSEDVEDHSDDEPGYEEYDAEWLQSFRDARERYGFEFTRHACFKSASARLRAEHDRARAYHYANR